MEVIALSLEEVIIQFFIPLRLAMSFSSIKRIKGISGRVGSGEGEGSEKKNQNFTLKRCRVPVVRFIVKEYVAVALFVFQHEPDYIFIGERIIQLEVVEVYKISHMLVQWNDERKVEAIELFILLVEPFLQFMYQLGTLAIS